MLRLIIVVVSGIILIILSYKLKGEIVEKDVNINADTDEKKEKENKFNDYLDNEEINSKITRIDDNIEELKKRIDEIQQSLLLIGDDVLEHDEGQNNAEKKDKDTENKQVEEKGSGENVKTNDEIFKMYDSGCSVEEICSVLKIGKGEVLLRLGLRK